MFEVMGKRMYEECDLRSAVWCVRSRREVQMNELERLKKKGAERPFARKWSYKRCLLSLVLADIWAST
jgi:hypothetical protein